MYDNEFDEYIRQVLGYSNQVDTRINSYNIENHRPSNARNKKIEEYYPEIYKVIYPMINKRCSNIEGEINKNMIDEITSEIVTNIEPTKNELQININLQNTSLNRNKNETENRNKLERKENRGYNNNLTDLVKILIIRELLGKPQIPNMQPPNFQQPGGVRPPIMRRWKTTDDA